jgi:hypothetical protein
VLQPVSGFGSNRSINKMAGILGITQLALRKTSCEHSWRKRAMAYDHRNGHSPRKQADRPTVKPLSPPNPPIPPTVTAEPVQPEGAWASRLQARFFASHRQSLIRHHTTHERIGYDTTVEACNIMPLVQSMRMMASIRNTVQTYLKHCEGMHGLAKAAGRTGVMQSACNIY